MPDLHAYGQAVQAGLAVLVLLIVARSILKPALVELFRQRLFELRREMFIEYVDGSIEHDRAYRLITRTMNGVIRYAEHVSFGRAFVGTFFMRNVDDFVDDVEIALDEADERSRALLLEYEARMFNEVARHMLLTSPLLWISSVVLVPVALVLALFSMLRVARLAFARLVSRVGRLDAVRQISLEARSFLRDDEALAS